MDSQERMASSGVPVAQARASARAGIAWMIVTTLLFVTQDGVSRVLMHSYPVVEVAWARFSVHVVWAVVVVGLRSPRLLVPARPGLQLVRSTLLLAVTLLSIVALGILPFVDVAAIITIIPVLVTVLSIPMLGETVGWRRGMAVLVGFAGALLVVGPAGMVFSWAVLLPVASAVLNAFYQITTRMLKGGDPPLTTFACTSVAGAVLLSLCLPFVWVTPDPLSACLMLALGSLGALSHFCMIRAYTAAPAATVAPFNYTTLVWATLAGVLVFDELPSLSTLAGSAVIVASGLYILYREQVRRAT